MFQINLCKNNICSQPVPDSLNKGVERVYCSARCASQQSQRNYRARSSGASGDGAFGIINGHPYVRRQIAPSVAAAEKRYKAHLLNCSVAKGGPCPSRTDPYDHHRLCLIHAVVREDWDQLRRAEDGKLWKREKTTENGFWIDAEEARFGVPVEKSDGDMIEFTEAGGAHEPPTGI